MITELRRQEIVGIFQASFKRDNSTELLSIPLAELIAVDEMLGDRDLNAGFRLRLRNRIDEIRQNEARAATRSFDLKTRWLDRTITFFGGILSGVAATLIGQFLINGAR